MSAAVLKPWWALVLLMLVLGSAFFIIASTHASRGFYAQLQDLEARRWYLEEEYSRLLLEQSTLASHYRIESEAGETLGLVAPGHEQTRLVAP
ncbi:cell division protein FtsL [Congregibacter litoralis]|uniref:Cell division protein FtsL n=1 Tax=Congregibacter litoralis KT71 TaxID=314285 RepID=A4A5F3_9GAMM|nr:cell division protein FtsL [Congregibacter litoralis]EAQ99024.1 cell division protein FtsL [Congregibacter litoralis KT71]